jgi:hypothetical protein
MRAVVDTNVMLVANRKAEQASSECVIECVKHLVALQTGGKLVLDNGWYLLREYGNRLSSSGQPGVGDAFYKWALSNFRNPECCETFTITPIESDPGNFLEFPDNPELKNFDLNDRKFAALSVVSKAPMWEAVDKDWWQCRDALRASGVAVEFLCPDYFWT